MEWIQVADSAVKIGLGAVIAGISTYATIKAKSNSDKEKIKLENRIALLQQASQDLENSFANARRFLNRMPVKVSSIEEGEKISDKEYFQNLKPELVKLEDSIAESSIYLNRAISNLTLVGFTTEDRALKLGITDTFNLRDDLFFERQRYSSQELNNLRMKIFRQHATLNEQIADFFMDL
ncbi:MAG: hypothetical protein CMF19_09830 [Idiomarinaceae bacterium]|nr:hypothetical protein [Idiomarinaceae bacterium]